MAAPAATFGPQHFINRELSWLEFNQRVLDEALNPKTPLLERVKFFCITSSNLDEFFEVRVAGLKQQVESEVVERSLDGLTATETLRAITKRVRHMVEQQYACWREDLRPALAENGIRFLSFDGLKPADFDWIENYYRTQVRPVLTPLAIDPAHPFPQLLNKSLNMMVQLEMPQGGQALRHLAVVQVPRILPRLVRLPREDSSRDYVFLGHLIGHYLADLFPGTRILGYWRFRVTRNSELYIDEEEVANLLKAVENELHNRRKGDAVRLEVAQDCPPEIRQALLGTLRLEEDDLYLIDGPLNPTRLIAIYEGDHSPELRDPPFVAPVAAAVQGQRGIFAAIRERDVLLHHPYENFSTVVDFLEQAAVDPDVLAIKQTLYRTGGDTRIVGALMNAVRNGKQVTAVVELRARFDEANNIEWARKLEEAGVHVVYGLVGYKIHGKMCLVVRRDHDGIRRYVHLGTGNYNPTTARTYTDISLLSCRTDLGEDITNLFNLLTGICQCIPGVSENISVRSVVDRFLEHSRIYYFENALQPEIFIGSADWMPRNFVRRIEVLFPIEDGNLRERVMSELLAITLADNVKARQLQPDGSYVLPGPKLGAVERRSQVEFMSLVNDDTRFVRREPRSRSGNPKVKVVLSPFKRTPKEK